MDKSTCLTNEIYRSLLDEFNGVLPYSFVYQASNQPLHIIGLEPEKICLVQNNSLIVKQKGESQSVPLTDSDFFDQVAGVLDTDKPCFFLVGPDIYRGKQDANVPSAIFIQPSAEIRVDKTVVATTWFSEKKHHSELEKKIKETLGQLPHKKNPKIKPSLALVTPWDSEPDGEFLSRLSNSIELLQSEPGKMIISRTYKKQIASTLEAFRLYEIYSNLEQNCAASHYANIGAHQYSLGCSPENIFELNDKVLSFDVIAATRGVSGDKEKDERWRKQLLEDEKEDVEHMMALERYKSRIKQLCEPNSIDIEFVKRIREFKHVRHLHSRLSGKLRQDVPISELLSGSYPPLNSYPDALISKADPRTQPHHFYGGMVGYIEKDWENSSCFLNIRAALLDGDQAITRGGVGVINESKAESEMLEVKNKLACLMEAFNIWQGEQHAS